MANIQTTCSNIGSNKNSISLGKNIISNKKDIYMVAEGYHKTDSCYYKTPDGGYHKLPPDSYHKMSEICYNKLPDGSFKRLIDIQNADSNSTNADITNTGTQNKMRNHMIKFLKRSKSHSQATAKDAYISYRKDIQRSKEKENHDLEIITDKIISGSIPGNKHGTYSNNHNITTHRNSTYSGNRKVVVTMMENGGLPIIATSKSKSSKNENKLHQNTIREKVK